MSALDLRAFSVEHAGHNFFYIERAGSRDTFIVKYDFCEKRVLQVHTLNGDDEFECNIHDHPESFSVCAELIRNFLQKRFNNRVGLLAPTLL